MKPKKKKKLKKEESEEKSEEKEEDSEEEKKKEEPVEEEEEESKFKELVTLCDEYKAALKESNSEVSKSKAKVGELETENKKLSEKISKFEEDGYNKVLNETVEKVSKFKGLNKQEELELKQKYVESKMSESALTEISRITDDQMFSKLSEPKTTTKPSEYLTSAPSQETDFSKMSAKDKLDVLALMNAKQGGFVKSD